MTVPAGSPPHRRIYRSASTARWAIGGGVATAAFCVLAVVPTRTQGLGFVMAPLLLLMTWRTSVMGIYVEADEIKVVGFCLSRRFRWDEVDHFAVLPLGGYPYVGHVVLRDGRKVGTYGIGAPGRPKSRAEHFRHQVQQPVDELNQVLAERAGPGQLADVSPVSR
jgi:hypothetical protein